MGPVFPGTLGDKPIDGSSFARMAPALTLAWEQLTRHAFRCRLPFCDVTIGLIAAGPDVLLIDTGTTLAEAQTIAEDVRTLTGHGVSHVLLTHDHFDHILGYSAFEDARTYCAPAVVATMTDHRTHLRADALRHGADPVQVDGALAALVPPGNSSAAAVLPMGDIEVTISHPGRGHTDHDLVAVVTGAERTVVFCGDLVEESGDACVDARSDLAEWPLTLQRILAAGGDAAAYVPGHGAVVDAAFVRRQAHWLARQS